MWMLAVGVAGTEEVRGNVWTVWTVLNLFTWPLSSIVLIYVGRIGILRLREVWIDYTFLEPIRDRSDV